LTNKPNSKINDYIEVLARASHSYYNDLRRKQELEIEYPTFEDLPENLKQANYRQIQNIPKKLAMLNYEIANINDEREGVNEFSKEEIEVLAEEEHDHWVLQKVYQGYTPGERDNDKKTTPYLVPYSQLSEDIKDYDRRINQDIPKILNLADLKVVGKKEC